MSLQFTFFYGAEAEQYSFYRIPKTLFSDKRFKTVSMEAKVLYGLMLDRMSLSIRNDWLDDDGRVYIYFTLEDAVSLLGCGKDKALKLFKELDAPGGIGLIQRRKQGQGKPARVYVMNFTLPPENEPEPSPEPPPQTSEKQKSALPGDAGAQTSEIPKSALREKSELQTSEKPKSALRKSRRQDVGKTDPNKTDKNNTYWNDTQSSIFPQPPAPPESASPMRKRMEAMGAYRALIQENIDYDVLLRDDPQAQEIIDGYVEQMVEVCVSRRKTIRVNQEDLPTELVRSRLLKLNSEHIVYVMDALRQNTTLVGNIKAYTLSALYNAPVTMKQYYTSLVSHDLAHGPGGVFA